MRRWVRIGLGALVVLLGIAWLAVVVAFDQETAGGLNMAPTIRPGESLTYRPGTGAGWGDIVVVEPTVSGRRVRVISRVVGVGGDRLRVQQGRLVRNGRWVDEPYLQAGTNTGRLEATQVPRGSVFLMGDNRTNSSDSRIYGPVPTRRVVGRVILVDVPLGRIVALAWTVALGAFVIAVIPWRRLRGPASADV